MYKWLLAFRYLVSRKIIYFSIAGIAVGVTALIVVTSVMGGFSRDMRERIRGVSAHLSISKGKWSFFDNYETIIQELNTLPHIKACAPRIEWGALMGRHSTTFVNLIGIDPVTEAKAGKFAEYLMDGKTPDFRLESKQPKKPGVIIGDDIFSPASYPRLIGHNINLITLGLSSFSQPPFLPQPIARQFTVVGRFKSGMYEYDSATVYLPLPVLQQFLGTKGVTKITIALDDYKYASMVKEQIQSLLEEEHFYVRTWEDEKRIFLTAVSIEKNINAVILFCIVIVAGFNILAMLTMRVVEKTRDIGILKALGGTTRGIMSLFLYQGLFIAGLGSGLGLGAGLLIATYLNEIEGVLTKLVGFKLFPSNIYQLDKIPSEVNLLSITIIIIATIGLSVLFSIYPAIKAARCEPVEALRYE